jgi:hypothetical protein
LDDFLTTFNARISLLLIGWVTANIAEYSPIYTKPFTSRVTLTLIEVRVAELLINKIFGGSTACTGMSVGRCNGPTVGTAVGLEEGGAVGRTLGCDVGSDTGILVGFASGDPVGCELGCLDGCLDG